MEGSSVELWEPSYKLEPDDDERFSPSKVEATLEVILNEKLKGKEYSFDLVPGWCNELCHHIRNALKALNLPRYKLAVQVVIVENFGQNLQVASRALWDIKVDNWAGARYSNKSLHAAVLVFGCYHE